MAEKSVSARIIVDSSQASAALKAFGGDAQVAFDIVTRKSQEASRSVERTGEDVRGFAGSAKAAFGQLGYQLQDFVVQVQGGTSVIVALTQQGSQLAGAFGPIPALIAGLTGGVVAAASAFLDLNEEVKKSPDLLGDLIKGFSGIEDSAKKAADEVRGLSQARRDLVAQQAEGQGKEIVDEARKLSPQLTQQLRQVYLQQELGGIDLNDEQSISQEYSRASAAAGTRFDQINDRIVGAVKAGNVDEVVSLIGQLHLQDSQANRDLTNQIIDAAKRKGLADTAKATAGELQIEQAYQAPGELVVNGSGLGVTGTELTSIGRPTPVPVARPEAAVDALIEADDRKRQQAAAKAKTDRERAAKENLDFELRQLDLYYDQQDKAEKEAQKQKKDDLDFELRQLDEYFKAQDDAQKEAQREAEKNAKEMADILTEPWRQLAAEVARITGDMFDEFLRKGSLSVDSLATNISDGVRGIVSQTLGTIVTQPLQMGVASLSQSLNQSIASGQGFGAGVQQWAQANPGTAALGAGALGLTAGNTITAATGGNMTGSTIGGLIGGGAGFLIGGPIGAGIGAFAGSTLGGFIGGGEQNLGNDRAALDYWTGAGTTWQDKNSSPENRRAVNAFASQVDDLVQAIAQLGGTVDNINLRFSAGNKTGLEFNGQTFGSQEELMAAVFRAIGGASSGLSENQQTVLQTTKAGTTAELAGDLSFADQLDRVRQNLGPVAQALADVDDQFTAMRQRASSLGLATDGLSEAYDKAVAAVRDAAQAQIDAFSDTRSPYASAFDQLNKRFEELSKTAAELGEGLDQLNAGYDAQAARIYAQADAEISAFTNGQFVNALDDLTRRFEALRQAAIDTGKSTGDLEVAYRKQADQLEKNAQAQVQAANDNLQSAVNSLSGRFDTLLKPLQQALGPFGISAGVAAPTATISGGLDQFRGLLAQARAGDVDAIQQLVGVGQQTLSTARQYGASGQSFQDVFKEVSSGLSEIQSKIQDRQIEALRGLEVAQRDTIDAIVAASRAQIASLTDLRDQLALELRQLADRRAAA